MSERRPNESVDEFLIRQSAEARAAVLAVRAKRRREAMRRKAAPRPTDRGLTNDEETTTDD